jgi:COP9 signalosome complex subunit 2
MISCKTPSRRSTWMLGQFRLHTNGTSYDFEYEDDDEEQSGDVNIENKYYNAKQLKADAPEEAIDEFLGVPALEEEKGDW